MNPTVSWLCVVLVTGISVFHCEGIKWLGLHKLDKYQQRFFVRNNSFCEQMRNQKIFTRQQSKYCSRLKSRDKDPENRLLYAAIEASSTTLGACKESFRNYRWNCQVLDAVPELAPELKTLTAEQALVHALSSYVLSYTFANECAKGITKRCSCGKPPKWLKQKKDATTFQYSGCHANIKGGEKLARKFLGIPRERKGNKRKKNTNRHVRTRKTTDPYKEFVNMVNIHNYKVGLNITRRAEAVVCKCHGTSSSCTMRSCHKVLHRTMYATNTFNPYYRKHDADIEPLDMLLEKYEKQKLRKAVYSDSKYQGFEEPCDPRDNLNPFGESVTCHPGNYKITNSLPEEDVLLFHEHSMDYCLQRGNAKKNETVFPGTTKRECLLDGSDQAKATENHPSSKKKEILCSVMCCGRRYFSENRIYPGNSKECTAQACRLIQNPIQIICTPCEVRKTFCH